MSNVGGITGSGGTNGPGTTGGAGSLTAANALAALKAHPTVAVSVSDTTANIVRYLDAFQTFAAKITSLTTTDTNQNMQVTATQYARDGGVMAVWGATSGQTLNIVSAKANITASLPSYVTKVSVADTSLSIQNNLGNLGALATAGLLQDIVQTGTPQALSITPTQLLDNQAALGKIKNQAYTLAIKSATVSDVLGLGGNPALTANGKIKSIAIVDTTDNIAAHLDDLQHIGLRIKSITQTDPTTDMSITGAQYQHDWLTLGKITTSDHLVVLEASALQAKTMSTDHRIVTVDIEDSTKNITKNWSMLQSLGDSLTSVKVTDQANDITLTDEQFTSSDALLAKLTDQAGQSYKLAITNVSASRALAVAGGHNVDHVDVVDSGDNLVGSLDNLESAGATLRSITLTNPRTALALDAARLQGDPWTATSAVLGKIKGSNYTVLATGVSTAALPALTTNKRITSIALQDTSANIQSSLDTLYHLGARLGSVEQTDSGAAYTLTQAQLDTRGAVLAKISGGYTVNLTDVSAAKAAADLRNTHVGTIDVTDTGRNILANWSTLLSLGNSLHSIAKSDVGALTLTATNYQSGVDDSLIDKFGTGSTFAITGATVAQAQTFAASDAVTTLQVAEDSTTLGDNLSALSALVTGGKLTSIVNKTPTTSVSMTATAFADSSTQDVLDLISGGAYTLALKNVDAAAAKDLVDNNAKIASMTVTGDGATIVANLSDLNAVGKKLTSITQTDAPAETLDMTGDAFEQNAATLAKIDGGYLAVLSDVSAAKAATFAANSSVSTIAVSDTGAHLASAWGTLADIGSKLTDVAQTDVGALQISYADWSNGQDLKDTFSTPLAVSVSGATVAQVDDLASDDAVQSIQIQDSSSAVAAALSDLASQSKLTQVVLNDPSVAMDMSSATYAGASDVLGMIKDHVYTANLSDVAAADVSTLAADAHVALMDVSDSSTEISSHFNALAAASNLKSIALTDVGGTVTLSAAQILGNPDAFDKFSTSFTLAATGVGMADLPAVQLVPQVSSIAISDSADNVSAGFGDILSLGGSLASIHLTDGSPVLSVSEQDFNAGTSALATINNGSYKVDVTDAVAGDAQAIAANDTVNHVTVADTASNIASHWSTLVSLYNEGAGKLSGIARTDASHIALTQAQQDAGATMINDLLSDETIDTV